MNNQCSVAPIGGSPRALPQVRQPVVKSCRSQTKQSWNRSWGTPQSPLAVDKGVCAQVVALKALLRGEEGLARAGATTLRTSDALIVSLDRWRAGNLETRSAWV
jgi:hypothetical protein